MRKIPVDDERIDRIYSAMQMHGFIVVDHWGKLDRLCYRDFIEAMFSGNPNVNLITIHKKYNADKTDKKNTQSQGGINMARPIKDTVEYFPHFCQFKKDYIYT